MTATIPATGPARLLQREYLPLTVGAVALVTLGAFENRAVGTALPTIVAQFRAVDAYGLANAAPTASYLVALTLAGDWADRRGPGPVLRAGVALFAVAQVLVGLAVSMPMVVAGRLLSGGAEALLDISLMVLVARVLPAALRPRMVAVTSASWVLPSVLGPVVTGVITNTVGWRWVFLSALALLLPTWSMLRPAVALAAGPAEGARQRQSSRTAPWACAAALAIFVLTLAGSWLRHPSVGALLALGASMVVLALAVVRLMPVGTLRAAPGLPAVVAMRGLVAVAFGGVGAFLPLLLTELHGFGPATAGISLSITGVTWAIGSWLQGRDHRLPRVVVLRLGLSCITVGVTLTGLLVVASLPTWWGLVGWAVAGVGMGLTSSSLAVLVLDLSADDEQGRNNGAAQTGSMTALAVAFALGGMALALAGPGAHAAAFAAILMGGIATGLLALLISVRVRPSTSCD